MTTDIEIGWGACAPMRHKHVLTALTPYGVEVKKLKINVSNEGSRAKVTVNDAQAREAEYWLCRSGLFALLSVPIDARNIEWGAQWHTLPAQRGCEVNTQAGTVGQMPEPGRKKKKPAKPTQRRPSRTKTIWNSIQRF